MLDTPPHQSEVAGFSLSVTPYPESLSTEGDDEYRIEPGFLLVEVESDGTNSLFPVSGCWMLFVVRSKVERELTFNTGDHTTVCQLMPGDSLHYIDVTEEALESHYGVWVRIGYERPTEGAMFYAQSIKTIPVA